MHHLESKSGAGWWRHLPSTRQGGLVLAAAAVYPEAFLA